MKFMLPSFLPVAICSLAAAAASNGAAPDSKAIISQANNDTQSALGMQFFDDDGKPIIFTSNAEELSDSLSRRNKKHSKHHKAFAKSSKKFKAVTSSLPTGQKKYSQKVKVTW